MWYFGRRLLGQVSSALYIQWGLNRDRAASNPAQALGDDNERSEMSYDLFFKPQDARQKHSVNTFVDYFKRRKHYNVTDKQAIYQNIATGVYFVFNFDDAGDGEQPNPYPVSFNLNYFRPHIFGLEAEPEVKFFVDTFNLVVDDPQIGGMGEGNYSTQGFLEGWNTGNEFGYQSYLKHSPIEDPPTLPTADIEACWRWNFALPELKQKLTAQIFVPRFMFLHRGASVVSLTLLYTCWHCHTTAASIGSKTNRE